MGESERRDLHLARLPDDAERGRQAWARRDWADAYEALTRADRASGLQAEDLEKLATAAFLVDREDAYLRALESAHHAHLAAGRHLRAVRCAFWLGLRFLFRGETGPGTGWLARGHRLLEREAGECAEHGYLMMPAVEQHIAAGECDTAFAAAARAAEIGDRFADSDLIACARHLQGRARLGQGRVSEGLRLLDEAMVAVASDKLSPLVTGLIYCSVIDACQHAFAVDRARQWTAALSAWCAEQPELVAFTGACLVHRAEVMQVQGAWGDALAEARRAAERFSGASPPQSPAAALYQQGEIHRLRGDFAAAEKAYRDASRHGLDPQPGMAFLRLAEGRTAVAAATIRRAINATGDRLGRARLLPASVEILLAAEDSEAARAACRELEEIANVFDAAVLLAMAAQARGQLALADGDVAAALPPLRRACKVWQEVVAPYMAARTRILVGLACRALGDDEGAALELDAARVVFEKLGAAPDLSRIEELVADPTQRRRQGLTDREIQVLRLVAAGASNKAIANQLKLSVRTVDRHVSNIFTKTGVSSRAAATAYAYRNKLV